MNDPPCQRAQFLKFAFYHPAVIHPHHAKSTIKVNFLTPKKMHQPTNTLTHPHVHPLTPYSPKHHKPPQPDLTDRRPIFKGHDLSSQLQQLCQPQLRRARRRRLRVAERCSGAQLGGGRETQGAAENGDLEQTANHLVFAEVMSSFVVKVWVGYGRWGRCHGAFVKSL